MRGEVGSDNNSFRGLSSAVTPLAQQNLLKALAIQTLSLDSGFEAKIR